jgi:uncharacterized protein YegP (UPF0339 family)
MATATKKSRDRRQVPRHAAVVCGSAAITFLVFEDNGGSYCWTVRGPDGESLAHSRPYATHEEAAHAVRVVHDGAASAGFKASPAMDLRVDLVARSSAPVARDDFDAERWLDEGGRFSRTGVTQ